MTTIQKGIAGVGAVLALICLLFPPYSFTYVGGVANRFEFIFANHGFRGMTDFRIDAVTLGLEIFLVAIACGILWLIPASVYTKLKKVIVG